MRPPPNGSIHQYPSLECLYRYGYAYTVTGMFSHTWFVHLQRDTLPVAVIIAMDIHFDDVHGLSFEHGDMWAMVLHMLLETCVVR